MSPTKPAAAPEPRVAKRARMVEVLLSVAASALTSAVVVSWSLSATLATFRAQLSEYARRIDTMERAPSMVADLAALKARQDNDDRVHADELVWRQRLEGKIDAILERRR